MFDLFEEYKKHLMNELNVSKSTYDSYIRDVSNYLSFVDISVSHNLYDVTSADIEEYKKALEKTGKTVSTINRSVASIKNFYKFIKIKSPNISDPTCEIRTTPNVRKAPLVLSSREMDKLLSAPDIRTPKGCRDKAMLELLYATGMRVSELIELDISDFNLKGGIVYCRGEENIRSIPIYKTAKNAVQEYLLRVYPYYSRSGNDALFINMNGSRLTRQGFWKIIKGYADELGLSDKITPHTLRHSFATHLIENGASVEDVSQMLGHADIASTQVYAQIVNNRFKDTYNRCHPRAKRV